MPEGVELSDFACAAIALSLNVGAYNTECVRAGILAVPHGQIEAAKALGLKPLQTFLDVVLPQSLRVALPALANNLASLVKDSSLLSIIAVSEFTLNAQEVNAFTFSTLESYLPLAVGYLLLTLPISLFSRHLEQKFRYAT